MKLTSDELNKPFGPPEMVDIFALTGGGDGVVDVLGAIRDQFIQPKGINVGEGGIAFQDIYSFSVQNVGIGPRPVIEYREGAQAKTLVGLTRDDAYTKPEVNNLLDGKTGLQDFWQFQSLFGSYESAADEKFRLLDQGLGFANTALKNLYTKPEVDAKLDAISAGAGASIDIVSENLSNGLIRVAALESGKADKADTYTKKEVDDKLEADKDFSIANDNVLLASITSLQEIVSGLSDGGGTGQIDVLAEIKGVEIEPSSIKLTGDAASPIAWKGGLSLAPVKSGNDWHLGWTDGKNTHQLVTSSEFTQENIVEALRGADVFINNLYLNSNAMTFGGPGGPAIAVSGQEVLWAPDSNNPNDLRKLLTADDLSAYAKLTDPTQSITAQSLSIDTSVLKVADVGGQKRLAAGVGSKTFALAYTSELAEYAKKDDANQAIIAKAVMAQAFAFDLTAGFRYMDTGEGYGTRLVFAYQKDGQEKIELIPYQSDIMEALAPLFPRMEALESRQAPAVDLSTTASKESFDLLQVQVQTIFDSVYTREEADARYAVKAAYVTTAAMNAATALMATRTYVDGAIDFQAKRLDATITETGVLANEITALKAATPTAAANINDPALDAFKKSVLDAVALMLAGGGKQPPADIGWTNCRNTAGTADITAVQVRMIGGVMEFKGTLGTGSISGSQNIFQIPASFPLPELGASYPIAARLVGTNAVYAYVNFNSTNRTVGVTMASTINEVTLSGLRVKAAY